MCHRTQDNSRSDESRRYRSCTGESDFGPYLEPSLRLRPFTPPTSCLLYIPSQVVRPTLLSTLLLFVLKTLLYTLLVFVLYQVHTSRQNFRHSFVPSQTHSEPRSLLKERTKTYGVTLSFWLRESSGNVSPGLPVRPETTSYPMVGKKHILVPKDEILLLDLFY